MMAGYTELYVVPVSNKSIEDYCRSAELFGKVWREHGALSFIEVEADDAPPGKVTSFPQSVDLQPEETVFVGIITYASRAHRDEVNAKAMQDRRLGGTDSNTMPFDPKRIFRGGFKPFVEA
jgi:uncharacterized protein YbaA (DUF1428 family)